MGSRCYHLQSGDSPCPNGIWLKASSRYSRDLPIHSLFFPPPQNLLTSTSRRLGALFNGHFQDVTIILPIAWAGSECVSHHLEGVSVSNWVLSKSFHPDFEVDQPHPIFGPDQPWSKQFGPCGQSGLGVTVPFTVLADIQNVTRATGKNFKLPYFSLKRIQKGISKMKKCSTTFMARLYHP